MQVVTGTMNEEGVVVSRVVATNVKGTAGEIADRVTKLKADGRTDEEVAEELSSRTSPLG